MNIQPNGKQAKQDEDFPVQVDLDEEALLQLDTLLDKVVMSMTIWTDPLKSEDEPYVAGIDHITRVLTRAVEQGIRLVEIAEEAESGAPIFIFEDIEGEGSLLVVADGWILDTWEALPGEE